MRAGSIPAGWAWLQAREGAWIRARMRAYPWEDPGTIRERVSFLADGRECQSCHRACVPVKGEYSQQCRLQLIRSLISRSRAIAIRRATEAATLQVKLDQIDGDTAHIQLSITEHCLCISPVDVVFTVE